MAISSKKALQDRLARRNAFVIRTFRPAGPQYSSDSGEAISAPLMENMIQLDLFNFHQQGINVRPPARKDELTANEDGLFPGFSQTWRLAK